MSSRIDSAPRSQDTLNRGKCFEGPPIGSALFPYSVINPGLLVRNCLVALRFAEKAGPSHPSVATNLNNLALLYDSQGQYA